MLPLLGHRCFTTQEMSMFSMIPIPAIGSSKQHLLTSRKRPYVWQAAATSGMAPAAVAKVGAWEIMPKIRYQRGGYKKYPRSFLETNPLMFDKEVHWLTNISSKIWRTQWWWIYPNPITSSSTAFQAHGPGLAPAQSKASSLNNSSYVSHLRVWQVKMVWQDCNGFTNEAGGHHDWAELSLRDKILGMVVFWYPMTMTLRVFWDTFIQICQTFPEVVANNPSIESMQPSGGKKRKWKWCSSTLVPLISRDQVISLIQTQMITNVIMNVKYHIHRHGSFTERVGTLNYFEYL